MKRIMFAAAAAAALLASPALAQSTGTTTSGTSNSNSGATAIVNGDTIYNPARTKQRIASTASGIAPGLTAAGVHSCAGSASIGVGGVGFNFGAGATYEMQECNRRAYAATLMGMGQNAAALALICNNPEVQSSLNMTGVICPQQRAEVIAAQQQAAASGRMAVVYPDDGRGASAGTRYIPANGRGGAQMIPVSQAPNARYASTTGSIGSAPNVPPFCMDPRTYTPSLCSGMSAPR
ncbi:hypothetical protein [Microvirga pakistanensis]|uniref:hypothetical protein n=1 Tax=Microvirga pakistanensis TaxID=1682650 RepID=UPI00106D4939|nr:hypothetical protein [Microvirga pakistanensis]